VQGGSGISMGGVVSVWLRFVTVTVKSSVTVAVTIFTGLVRKTFTPEQFEAVIL
jgi:hypothetical protein